MAPAMVVRANRIRVISQRAGKQVLHRLVRRALHAWEQPDARLRQRLPRPGPDAPADERIYAPRSQKACQRPMAAALCGHGFGRYDFAILHIIYPKGLRMAKMLKYPSAFISNGNFHFPLPFLFCPAPARRSLIYHTAIFCFWQCPCARPVCSAGGPVHKIRQPGGRVPGGARALHSFKNSEVFHMKIQHYETDAGVAACRKTPGAVLVDVRTPGEFRSGHIPGSINLPLEALAAAPLPQGPLFVYCRSGQRSRAACRILAQRGAAAADIGGILFYHGSLTCT